jgi:hypothetical protein
MVVTETRNQALLYERQEFYLSERWNYGWGRGTRYSKTKQKKRCGKPETETGFIRVVRSEMTALSQRSPFLMLHVA